MDSRAITKAESRLRVAKQAAQDLPSCRDFEAFTDTWYKFLTSAKNIYTVLEQGAKTSPQSRQWFGAKATFRRNDPLLQYLYEARNADEHGLEPISEVRGGDLRFSFPEGDFSGAVHVRRISESLSEQNFKIIDVDCSDGKTIDTFQSIPKARLIEVDARGNRKIQPPINHKGKNIDDRSPEAVASLALVYLDSLISEARGLA